MAILQNDLNQTFGSRLVAGLNSAIAIGLICAIGLVAGGWSVFETLRQDLIVDKVEVGPWIAYPGVGRQDADPYTAARAAQLNTLPLGQGEGIVFQALNDSRGDRLHSDCSYILIGDMPSARIWTLTARDADGRSLVSTEAPQRSMHSKSVHRMPGQDLEISVSAEVQPSNWMAVTAGAPMELVLRFYDTPITSPSGLVDLRLPKIEKLNGSSTRADGCPQ